MEEAPQYPNSIRKCEDDLEHTLFLFGMIAIFLNRIALQFCK